ncbi:ANKLE2 [Acanthosepion pharaonis]|uniref:ANKLE2 n=1 Tax=Acanthosepion pharaonis TaxID=158019 RepID=A0A812DLU5_ACAPH|nr:ANKLE2 [Sepia pharaonis]
MMENFDLFFSLSFLSLLSLPPPLADQFRKLWRSPCSRNEQNNVFREDHEKGYERVGRTLALQNNVPCPPDDSPIEDADLKISEKVNTNMNCLFSMKDEFIDMLNAVQNQEPLSVSFMTQASCDKPTYPCLSPALHAPASPQSSTTAGPVLLNIKSPKKLIAQINGMPAKSPPELRKPLKVYIQGSVPTKLDIDVMHCLKNVTVDSEQFPYTAKWLKLVNSFSEIEKKSWTSPAKAHEKKVKTNDGTGTPVMKSRTASRLEPMALFNSPSTDT